MICGCSQISIAHLNTYDSVPYYGERILKGHSCSIGPARTAHTHTSHLELWPQNLVRDRKMRSRRCSRWERIRSSCKAINVRSPSNRIVHEPQASRTMDILHIGILVHALSLAVIDNSQCSKYVPLPPLFRDLVIGAEPAPS